MKPYMKKTAVLSHIFFAFFFCFLLCACFFRYLRFPLAATLAFSCAVALCLSALLAAILGKKRETYLISARAEREKDALLQWLTLAPSEEIVNFLSRSFFENPSNGENAFLAREVFPNLYAMLPDKNHNEKSIEEKRLHCHLFFYFSREDTPLNVSESLLRAIDSPFSRLFTAPMQKTDATAKKECKRGETIDEPTLFCSSLSEASSSLLQKFAVKAVTLDEIFNRAKLEESLPDEVLLLANEKKRRNFRFRGFSKKTSRGLLLSAALLLFTSLFSPFPYYYRVSGLLLLFASLAVRIVAVRSTQSHTARENAKNKTNESSRLR